MTISTTLITGAGGFIGQEVARALAARQQGPVLGATRDGRALGAGIVPLKLDVCAASDLAAALRGVDAVIHCAVGGRRTTVDGTATLLQAAERAGVRRVVHLSSIAVYGSARGVVDEATACVAATGRGYAHWKAAAERHCQTAAPDVVVLRPAIVYGPGACAWVSRSVRRILSGGWRGLGLLGRGTCNLVHVQDVAAACVAALGMPVRAQGAAFNIAGREAITWNAWFDRIAAALGLPAPPALAPAAWRWRTLAGLPFKAASRLSPSAARLFDRRILAAPARAELALFSLTARYPIDKAANQLGWEPRIGLEEGLAGALASLNPAECLA